MRIVLAAFVAMTLVTPVTAQEAVNLSRYRLAYTAPEGPSETLLLLELAPFNERCRDLDGCEISLLLENASGIVGAKYGRIYLSAGSSDWLDIAGALHTNGNNAAEAAATATGPNLSCALSDRDLPPNNDPADSYTLILNLAAEGTATCTLTVID